QGPAGAAQAAIISRSPIRSPSAHLTRLRTGHRRRRRRVHRLPADHPDVRAVVLPHDPPADEAREGNQVDDRGPAEGRRGGHRGRDRGQDLEDGRAVPDPRDRAQHRDQRAEGGGTDAPAEGNAQEPAVVNRFPVWKYTLIAIVILAAFLYTVPNFFGESPAVQVSSAKSTVKVDTALLARVEDILKKESIPYSGAQVDATGVRVRFADPDTQLRAKDLIERALNAGTDEGAYTVALNLLPASPSWLARINALPMYLGLDLRGGVHFLLQIDMPAASLKRIENLAADVRSQLREKNIRHGGV